MPEILVVINRTHLLHQHPAFVGSLDIRKRPISGERPIDPRSFNCLLDGSTSDHLYISLVN